MPLKICVIGLGWVADAMHGPAYIKYNRENNGLVFAGCCDIDEKRAVSFRDKYGFKQAYNDWEKMLEKEKPDAVCLLTPYGLIPEIAGKILSSGIPMILEKPPGETPEQTRKLIETAERTKTPHLVAFNRRYSPLIIKMREQISSLTASTGAESIQSLQYDMFRIGRKDQDFSTTAIHAIDAVRLLCGSDYKDIKFTYRPYPELGDGVTDIHIQGVMKSGTVITLNLCPVAGVNAESAVAHIHDHSIYMDHTGNEIFPHGRLIHLDKGKKVLDMTCADMPDGLEQFEREGFYRENKVFFDAVISGNALCDSLQTSLQSVEVADMIRRRITAASF